MIVGRRTKALKETIDTIKLEGGEAIYLFGIKDRIKLTALQESSTRKYGI